MLPCSRRAPRAQLFANKLRFDDDGYALRVGSDEWFDAGGPSERLHFDSIGWAMTTVYCVLTGEVVVVVRAGAVGSRS